MNWRAGLGYMRLGRVWVRARRLIAMLAMLATAAPGVAVAADHSHVAISIAVPADALGSPGDIIGIYAIEMLPCRTASGSTAGDGPMLERLLGMVIGRAYANHRERIDGPAAKEVLRRVPLDAPQTLALGELVTPHAVYCEVRLTLARLPSVQNPVPLPALPVSLRMARPGNLPALQIDYSQPLSIKLSRPWTAEGCAAQLAITMRPGNLHPLLANAALDFGQLSQLVITGLAQNSEATLGCN